MEATEELVSNVALTAYCAVTIDSILVKSRPEMTLHLEDLRKSYNYKLSIIVNTYYLVCLCEI